MVDWINLRDFDEALHHARVAVIKRYARGNISFQNGNILDDSALDVLREQGDRALNALIEEHSALHARSH